MRGAGWGLDPLGWRAARELLDQGGGAAEHFAFCPDNVTHDHDSLRTYARKALLDTPVWTFWWD